jgi:hypothetical protein
MTATSYTKDYDGPFPEGGPLARVNIEVDGQDVVSIPRSLLETIMHDIGRDINTPHLIQEAKRILRSDDCRADQLRKLDDLFLPNVEVTGSLPGGSSGKQEKGSSHE